MTTSVPGSIDRLDAALIKLLAGEPWVGVLEASRRLSTARGTVQARLDRMRDRGVITGYGPDVDPAALAMRSPRSSLWRSARSTATILSHDGLLRSPKCWRFIPLPAPATCSAGWSRAATLTCSVYSTRSS